MREGRKASKAAWSSAQQLRATGDSRKGSRAIGGILCTSSLASCAASTPCIALYLGCVNALLVNLPVIQDDR